VKRKKMKNEKNGRKSIMMILLVVVLSASFFAMAPSVAAQGVKVQMAVCVDGSGSISGSEWNLMVEGLAKAVENSATCPQDGSVELTIVQFAGSTASLEVAPTVIDSQATATTVATTIRTITKRGGYTPTSQGIIMATAQITGSPNFDPAVRQIIDIATNGHPQPISSEVPATIAARNAAIADGIDEIDSEAIGVTTYWRNWLRDNIVYPEPGVDAPPYPDPPGSVGFVREVQTFGEFEEAIKEKFEAAIPDLTLAPVTASNCVDDTHTLTATLTSNGAPVPGATITFTVTAGPHTGITGTDVTDASGKATWSYTGTTVGTDTIVATGAGETSNVAHKTWQSCIPEFSTIALPVASILGLLFFFNYRKRRREQ
jgi:hypothetical protein